MADCVETMYYTSNEENGRFKPWHGLGTPVETAPTSADAIRLAGLDWDVTQREVRTVDGLSIPGYYANVRSSDKECLWNTTLSFNNFFLLANSFY